MVGQGPPYELVSRILRIPGRKPQRADVQPLHLARKAPSLARNNSNPDRKAKYLADSDP